jgi:predicted Fe-Mo cluster-binding NifX family protein
MRIAVASDDGMDVAAHTGRCRGFVVFDVSGQEATRREYRANTFTAHAQGKCAGDQGTVHEHAAHGPLLDALGDCRVLVTRGLGPRLVADLSARGVEAYVCDATQAEEAARQYAQGRLTRAAGCGCCKHS